MATLSTAPCDTMASHKSADDASEPRSRIDLRVDEDWYSRVEAMARRFSMSMSAYIRLAVTERLERDEANLPPASKKAKTPKRD